MNKQDGYLTEEELEALILDIEANDLNPAPPELTEQIMEKLELTTKSQKNAYRKYCLRVISSAAAAILLVFTIPVLFHRQRSTIPSRDTVIAEKEIRAKEEVLADSGIMNAIGNSHFLSNLEESAGSGARFFYRE